MSQLSDYKWVFYRQPDGSWAAYVPALEGCHAVMPTREEAVAELQNVFDLIRQEYAEEGRSLPADRELICA